MTESQCKVISTRWLTRSNPRSPGEQLSLLACRHSLFFFTRLLARSHLLVAPTRMSVRRKGLAITGALAADVVTTRALARKPGFGLRTRLALDLVDATFWRCLDGSPAMPVAQLGLPLAAEAGTRESKASLAVPVAHAAAAVLGRRDRRESKAGLVFATQTIAALAGLAAGRYERSQRRQAGLVLNQRAAAAREQQRFAGMNSVAMGADSIVDLLSRTAPLISEAGQRDILARSLAAWKGWLAETSQQGATYLGTALRRWEHHHNQHPDLRADVIVDVDQGDGTILLSHDQARHLEQLLGAVPRRGRVEVRTADRRRRFRPGASIDLLVNGEPLRVPKDPDSSAATVDIGALAIGLSAAGSVLAGLDYAGQARRRFWASAVAQGVAAVWAHRQVALQGPQARKRVLGAAVAASALQTGLVAPILPGRSRDAGIERLPFLVGLVGPLSESVFYGSDIPPWLHVATWGVCATCTAVGLAVTPGDRRWRDLVAALTGPLALVGPAYVVGKTIKAEAAAATDAFRENQAAEADRSYEDGRRVVIDLVADAVADGWDALADARGVLPVPLAVEAQRRLLEAERRLATLRGSSECQHPSGLGQTGQTPRIDNGAMARSAMTTIAPRHRQ